MRGFQHLATLTYPSDLAIAKSLLESMNIECYVKDELTVQVHNFYSNALGGITLEVPKDKYNSARNLLIESGFENDLIEPDNNFIELEEEEEEEGSFNLLKILKFSIRFIVIIAIVLILIVLMLVFFYDK